MWSGTGTSIGIGWGTICRILNGDSRRWHECASNSSMYANPLWQLAKKESLHDKPCIFLQQQQKNAKFYLKHVCKMFPIERANQIKKSVLNENYRVTGFFRCRNSPQMHCTYVHKNKLWLVSSNSNKNNTLWCLKCSE